MSVLSYSAAVLCGGHSSRMGRDKALLPAPASGAPLLLHQLATLARLTPSPAARLVGARTAQNLPALPADVLRLDDDGTAGPLGALVNLLTHAPTPHVLVVPVDAPFLDASTLNTILEAAAAHPGRPVAAVCATGLQPLVAVYPRTVLPVLRDALAAGQLGLRRLLTGAAFSATLHPVPFPDDRPFANWNTPSDRIP